MKKASVDRCVHCSAIALDFPNFSFSLFLSFIRSSSISLWFFLANRQCRHRQPLILNNRFVKSNDTVSCNWNDIVHCSYLCVYEHHSRLIPYFHIRSVELQFAPPPEKKEYKHTATTAVCVSLFDEENGNQEREWSFEEWSWVWAAFQSLLPLPSVVAFLIFVVNLFYFQFHPFIFT